ncbi:MAG: YtxH domain-containing protein [Clostridia bacterium]|nr:YtxH domain-containing protein [Clostridia bacterium]
MGFLLGAGLMMTPSGRELRRDVMYMTNKMKRWMRSM